MFVVIIKEAFFTKNYFSFELIYFVSSFLKIQFFTFLTFLICIKLIIINKVEIIKNISNALV